MERPNYLKAFAVVLLLLGGVVLYALEFRYFNLTLQVRSLVLWSVAAGVVLGAFLGYRYQRKTREQVEKIQIYAFFILLSAVFMPLLGSLSNRLLSLSEIAPVPVEFLQEEARYADRFGITKGDTVRPNEYFLFFYKDGDIHRIKTTTPEFSGKERGDTILLPIRKGLWGYEIVRPDALPDPQRNRNTE